MKNKAIHREEQECMHVTQQQRQSMQLHSEWESYNILRLEKKQKNKNNHPNLNASVYYGNKLVFDWKKSSMPNAKIRQRCRSHEQPLHWQGPMHQNVHYIMMWYQACIMSRPQHFQWCSLVDSGVDREVPARSSLIESNAAHLAAYTQETERWETDKRERILRLLTRFKWHSLGRDRYGLRLVSVSGPRKQKQNIIWYTGSYNTQHANDTH